ncbi:MAG: LCP family protein, partial [Spirochaetota bacterium]
MRTGGIDKGVVLLLIIVAVIAGIGVSVAFAVRTDAISDLIADEEQLVVLLAVELDDGRLMTEVVFYEFSTGRGALFEVPAETGTVIRSLSRIDSIDTVFFAEGVERYTEEVSSLLGTDIPFYIHVTESGLEALVDLVSGVPVFVTDLPDEGPEAVRIPSGDVILDGAKALEYLRYRSEGEREREPIARRQKLVVSLLEELGNSHAELSGRPASRLLMSRLSTNIERRAFISLMRELDGLESDRMITRQVEGVWREVSTGEVEELLLFPHQEGRWLQESVRQVVENLASEESIR